MTKLDNFQVKFVNFIVEKVVLVVCNDHDNSAIIGDATSGLVKLDPVYGSIKIRPHPGVYILKLRITSPKIIKL